MPQTSVWGLSCPLTSLPAISTHATPLMGLTQLGGSPLLLVFRSHVSAPSVPNMRGNASPRSDGAHRHLPMELGSRTVCPRWYFQGCPLLFWLKDRQFRYPGDHSYTSVVIWGHPAYLIQRFVPSPSSTFPTVPLLSSH